MQQSKVSIVIPCYNKEEYILEMLDSVISQHWDNIEIILVNDGSTDNTGNIITDYDIKFKDRGYKSKIIHQSNAGVCAAVKTGLSYITGDYLCIVDADDVLDEMYVKTMADILDESPQHDAVTCAREKFSIHGNKRVVIDTWSPDMTKEKITAFDYITVRSYSAIWAYMIRTSFFSKLGVEQNYTHNLKGSHEPGFMIPFTVNEPMVKPVDKYLYYFRVGTGESHSQLDSYEKIEQYRDEYKDLQIAAINALPNTITNNRKKVALSMLCEYYAIRLMWKHARGDKNETKEKWYMSQLIKLVNKWFTCYEKLTDENVENKEGYFFFTLEEGIMHLYNGTSIVKEQTYNRKKRTIGYGALGKAAQITLPLLKGTQLEPTELWDIAGDGIKVKRPQLETLTKEDRVIVLPFSELHEIFSKLPCETISGEQLTPYRDILKKKMNHIDTILRKWFEKNESEL